MKFFKRFYLFIFRERKGGRKRGRETSMCGCLSCTPHWGPGSQPKHVPQLATLWFTAGSQSTELHQPRLTCEIFKKNLFSDKRERERDVNLLFHLFMHSLVASCMCPDQGSNPQPWSMWMTLYPSELPSQGADTRILKEQGTKDKIGLPFQPIS